MVKYKFEMQEGEFGLLRGEFGFAQDLIWLAKRWLGMQKGAFGWQMIRVVEGLILLNKRTYFSRKILSNQKIHNSNKIYKNN